MLPKVAAEVSAPLSQVDKITMVSDGDGPIGASKVGYSMIDKHYITVIKNFHKKSIEFLPLLMLFTGYWRSAGYYELTASDGTKHDGG